MALNIDNFDDVVTKGRNIVSRIKARKAEIVYLEELLAAGKDGDVLITIQSGSKLPTPITVPIGMAKNTRKKFLAALKREMENEVKALNQELKALVKEDE